MVAARRYRDQSGWPEHGEDVARPFFLRLRILLLLLLLPFTATFLESPCSERRVHSIGWVSP
jgi:hypothetical protein